MLTHGTAEPAAPTRVVVLGKGGFVARHTSTLLAQARIETIGVGRPELDLTQPESIEQLTSLLRPTDQVLFVSAKAPCRNVDDYAANLAMAQHAVKAFEKVRPAHLVYVSSDAVYDEADALVRETTRPAPSSMHGAMHFARERLLALAGGAPLCIVRPSLLYGADDPHNGYGPNRFARMASRGETISLFGDGEEQRDHVFIEDVARLLVLCLQHHSTGILNIATGTSLSFRTTAEAAVALFNSGKVEGTPRKNPITHRHFDPTAALKSFPGFSFTRFEDGFRTAYGTKING